MHIVPNPAERLILWRKRNGYNQKDAAKIFEVTIRTLVLWEQVKKFNVPYVELYVIYPWERCFILRHRNGLSLRAMASTLNVTKNSIVRWEQGTHKWGKLADYYESLGWDIQNKYYT